MSDHQEIKDISEFDAMFPRPWRVEMKDGECWGVVAANGNRVIETDSGYYPPGGIGAAMIVFAVNRLNYAELPPA